MSDNTTTQSERFSLNVTTESPQYRVGINSLKEKAEFPSRHDDSALVNKNKGASLRLFDNKLNLAASQNTSIKQNDGQVVLTSLEERHTTNRISIDTDEVIINGHKLNPNLWEYTDFKQFKDMYQGDNAVGNFCLLGTVLVPTWDTQLKKYMLVRRLTRMPMFAPKTNVPQILKSLNIEDNTEVAKNYTYKGKSESVEDWYKKIEAQVNAENKNKEANDNTKNDNEVRADKNEATETQEKVNDQ